MAEKTNESMIAELADGRTDLVFDLFERGCAPGSMDGNGVSLIQWCAYYGDVSAIKFLLSKGESIDALGPDRGLNAASFHGPCLTRSVLQRAACSGVSPLSPEEKLASAPCSSKNLHSRQ